MDTPQTETMTVYGKPSGCVQCTATHKLLTKVGLREGVDYIKIDVTDPANARDVAFIRDELGYSQVPVVVTAAGEHWSGFRPDRIKDSAQSLHEGGRGAAKLDVRRGEELQRRAELRAVDLPRPSEVAGQMPSQGMSGALKCS